MSVLPWIRRAVLLLVEARRPWTTILWKKSHAAPASSPSQDSVLPAPTFSRRCLNRLGKRPCLYFLCYLALIKDCEVVALQYIVKKNSSGVNVQPWPGNGGLFEGLSHRSTFSSRTHGRPTSMAFSQACLSSVLKKLVQGAPSLATVRASERRAISPRGSSSKVSQPRRGGEPPGESMGAVTNCLLFGGRGAGEEEIRV